MIDVVIVVAALLAAWLVWYAGKLRYENHMLRWRLMMERQRRERHEAGIDDARLDEYGDG